MLLVVLLLCAGLFVAGVALGKPYGFVTAALALLAMLAAVIPGFLR
jgi:hypothetical protein